MDGHKSEPDLPRLRLSRYDLHEREQRRHVASEVDLLERFVQELLLEELKLLQRLALCVESEPLDLDLLHKGRPKLLLSHQ